jgi:hypothetical protein
MNLETQAAIVNQWFGGIPTMNAPFRQPGHGQKADDPCFSYIQDDIRNLTS